MKVKNILKPISKTVTLSGTVHRPSVKLIMLSDL